jgi:hypothetical protein
MDATAELDALLRPYAVFKPVPWDDVLAALKTRSAATAVDRYDIAIRTETFPVSRRFNGIWVATPGYQVHHVLIRQRTGAWQGPGISVWAEAADLGLSTADIQLYLDTRDLIQCITATLDPLSDDWWTIRCWAFQDRIRQIRDDLQAKILAAHKDAPHRRRRHLLTALYGA